VSRGIQRERQVRKLMENDGYWTMRAAGSLGDADVLAVKARPGGGSTVVLVEVKSDVRGPFAHFGPEARAELIAAAVKTGATPILCYWPPRRQPAWIHVRDWPATEEGA
jgi:Holliday junction resolvase